MKHEDLAHSLLILFAGLLLSFQTGIAAKPNSCIECHTDTDEELVKDFQDGIHAAAGLSCADCHGGNPALDDEDSMDPKYGFAAGTDRLESPNFCGKCHSDPEYMRTYNPSLPTDQVAKYWTSRHGKLLKGGDEKVAVCTSCHGVHGILPANARKSRVYPINVPSTCGKCHSDREYMAEYGIPTNQYAQYKDSLNVHGYALLVKRDIGAPACNDCHGNHGATPPGTTSIAQICSQCHALNGEHFRDSPHKDGFDALDVPECAFCHQASPDVDAPLANLHKIVRPTAKLVGTHEGAVCIQCHDDGDDGWETAATISMWRDSLDLRLARAHEMLDGAEEAGLEVSDAKWVLDSDVHQAVMELRTRIHAFDLEQYQPAYKKADTSLTKVLLAGDQALEEVGGRRTYALVMTILILILIITLSLRILEIKRSREAA